MRYRIAAPALMLLATGFRVGVAQGTRPASSFDSTVHRTDLTFRTMRSAFALMEQAKALQAIQFTGSIPRAAIPNAYLYVVMTKGTAHIAGGASDKIDWVVALRADGMPQIRPVRVPAAADYSGYVAATASLDRYTLRVGGVSAGSAVPVQGDLRLRVPGDLKLLHLIVHGTGKVVVDDFAGELTVTADSGDIVATNVSGATILEAREGGVELDLSATPSPRGPISLLSHDGSITVFLPAQPSVALNLSTSCGQLNSDFPLLRNGRPIFTEMTRMAGMSGGPPECTTRPKSLPPLPGVMSLDAKADVALGAGAVTLRAMALQGDINLRTKAAPAAIAPEQLDERGRPAVVGDSVPRSIADAERQGARHLRVAPNNPRRSWDSLAAGTSESRCVDVDRISVGRSGDFIAGPFARYNEGWQQGYGKLIWQPFMVSSSPAPLIVRAARLDGTGEAWVFDGIVITGNGTGTRFYPTGVHLATAGRWLLVATAGGNWGCFVLTVR